MDLSRKNVVTFGILACAALAAGVSYGSLGTPKQAASLLDANGNVIPSSVDPGCSTNEDCAGTSSVCINTRCTDLKDAVCFCSEPKKLTCSEPASGRARHTYCDNGCGGGVVNASCIK